TIRACANGTRRRAHTPYESNTSRQRNTWAYDVASPCASARTPAHGPEHHLALLLRRPQRRLPRTLRLQRAIAPRAGRAALIDPFPRRGGPLARASVHLRTPRDRPARAHLRRRHDAPLSARTLPELPHISSVRTTPDNAPPVRRPT